MPIASFKENSMDMAVLPEGLFVDTASISGDQDQTGCLCSVTPDDFNGKNKYCWSSFYVLFFQSL